jgi:hypothetical protein
VKAFPEIDCFVTLLRKRSSPVCRQAGNDGRKRATTGNNQQQFTTKHNDSIMLQFTLQPYQNENIKPQNAARRTTTGHNNQQQLATTGNSF